MPWAERICRLLEDGHWEAVLNELDPEEKYEGAVNLYHYIETNKEHIDYPQHREKGWFIGSGAVESGCWERDVDDFVSSTKTERIT